MIEQKLVTFTEVVKEDISRKGLEDQTLPLDYTDPEALEVEFEIDLRLKDSEGNLWRVTPEDTYSVIHLVREDKIDWSSYES
jgi:hypothetical protein